MPLGSIIGGLIGQGGANAAAGMASNAGYAAGQMALNQRKSNESLAAPYTASGWAATNALLRATGLGHLTPYDQAVGTDTYGFTRLDNSNTAADRAGALADFQASPSYDWRLSQGVNALDRSAASRGMLLSGAQGKAVTDYGQNQASQEWGNYINQLMNISGQGAGVTNATNNADTSAINVGNHLATTGALQAANDTQSGANAFANGLMSGLNNLGSIAGYTGFGKNMFGSPKPAQV